ncbi:HAD-IA family hydrolase [Candidatus Micrarchaeota archaeon]|nr:HAD-IA family hydrolase [Candidatus Micrarchaeota archaeon]
MIKAVLFDVDGTLISLDIVVEAIQHVCKKRSLRVLTRDEIYAKIIGYPLSVGIRRVLPMSDGEVEAFDKDYIEHYAKYHVSHMLPHVRETIQTLKDRKIKIGIVTTKGRETAAKTIKDLKISHDVIITADDVKHVKPDAEPALKACKTLGVKPEDAVMVGDHVFDVRCARNAGCIAVGVTTGVSSREQLINERADYVFDDIKSVLELV